MKENGINRNLCTTQRRWIRKESKGDPRHGVEGAVLIHRIVSQIDGPRDGAVALVRLPVQIKNKNKE